MKLKPKIDAQNGSASRAKFVPPAMFGETAWDILVALFADKQGQLTVEHLARISSVPTSSCYANLADLERQRLVTGDTGSGEVRAVLTTDGRSLLGKYLSAAAGLQHGGH